MSHFTVKKHKVEFVLFILLSLVIILYYRMTTHFGTTENLFCIMKNKSLTLSSCESKELPDSIKSVVDKKRLIIYTRFRSGSSFVGSIFAHNPLVYYMFEPMKFVEFSNRSDSSKEKIFSKSIDETLSCKFRSVFESSQASNWYERAFCAQPFYKCGNLTSLQNICKQRNFVVQKDICIPSLKILDDKAANSPTVLHLVRDPRGMVDSVSKFTTVFSF